MEISIIAQVAFMWSLMCYLTALLNQGERVFPPLSLYIWKENNLSLALAFAEPELHLFHTLGEA